MFYLSVQWCVQFSVCGECWMLEKKHALLEEDMNRRAESDAAMRGRAFMVSPPGASTAGGSASKTDYQLHDKTNAVNNTRINKQVEESKDSMS